VLQGCGTINGRRPGLVDGATDLMSLPDRYWAIGRNAWKGRYYRMERLVNDGLCRAVVSARRLWRRGAGSKGLSKLLVMSFRIDIWG
jgi:hypothetical protein